MYFKCGQTRDARMIYDELPTIDLVSWTVMIVGYTQARQPNDGLRLFADEIRYAHKESAYDALRLFNQMRLYFLAPDVITLVSTLSACATLGAIPFSTFINMLKEDLKLNEVIFTTVLSACSYSGMVEEGGRYFKSMIQDYNFVPSMKHYACMVDLLARSGKLDEALDFIKKMPVQRDVSLYGAFLHGCGLYSRFDLGEVVLREMLQLHRNEACYYGLLYNLYASNGKWGEVNKFWYFNGTALLIENGKFLLSPKPTRRTTSTEYIISMGAENILRSSSSYIGKLRWVIEVNGALGTLCANETYQLQVDFPEHYPMETPQVIYFCIQLLCIIISIAMVTFV
ncbi:pentatricopeptide repeat-containing protein At2g03380, mitochondrial-like [Cucumis sativus]|uniref:pentatricopeptide repeat-containing protein At2g03380, mitochondrial-like n=1 Tax=Cucumis sativus TaxID=3659 RepID=UPI0012F47D34|nr:pentatricopeptide repeat-containing protein At2g03380, mitochondrial-like [Cucumis sativus]